jgi:glutaredoxin-like YruB-family protein
MSKQKVVIYTQPGCSACNITRRYLTEKGIEFEDKNIREDETALKEMIEKHDSNATPTVLIGNNEVIIGFDKDRLEKLLT